MYWNLVLELYFIKNVHYVLEGANRYLRTPTLHKASPFLQLRHGNSSSFHLHIFGKYVLCNWTERILLYLKSYLKIEILYVLTTSKYKLNLHEYVVYCTDWFLLISGRYHWGCVNGRRPWSYLQWLYHATWIYRFFAQRSGIDQCIDQKNHFESTTCI